MDLWSDDPAIRLAAAQDPMLVGDWPSRIGAQAPMKPWPYGMPSSINPFVVFLGPSPGNSPPVGDAAPGNCKAYDLPTAGVAHPKLYVCDTRNYWNKIRELGALIVQARAPEIAERNAHALLGQLNLGTGQFGDANHAPFESEYCRWVPDVQIGRASCRERV